MTQSNRGSNAPLPSDKAPNNGAIESKKPDPGRAGPRDTASDPFKSNFPPATSWANEFAGWPWQFDRFFPGMSDFVTAFAARRERPPAAPTPHAPGASEPIEQPPSVDRLVQTALGKTTFSISPVSLALAYFDWATHLAMSPGKQAALVEKAARKTARFAVHAMRAVADPCEACCIEPLAQDRRFDHPAWQQLPYRFIYESFLLTQQWWHNATTGVHGVSRHHEQVVSFAARQMLDVVSPANFVVTNPEVLAVTVEQGGKNLVQGAVNLIEDWERAIAGRPPVGSEVFQPGDSVALTPGTVVFRNPLIELIQYKPSTSEVQAEPVLIVPAPIMKYYILDLSPQNSLVKYLVDRGHTVFMMSWHNPASDDRDLGMADYLSLGLMPAIEAVKTIVPERKINAVGYCLGGTLLSIAAAQMAHEQMAHEKNAALNTVSLFAAQVDFADAGELMLFIDESQLAYLEDLMWDQGYLDTKQMSGAFQLLRSNDLIWSRSVHDYLLGRRTPMTDLMAWNADATRMPYRMHSEYLRRLFLNNDLVEGRYEVAGRPVALSDIHVPIFAVGTETDHVAPWRSVYKLNLLLDAPLSFVLTSGGHNAGIVSEPGHPRRFYRLSHRESGGHYVDPETWYAATPRIEGSWWPAWADWLESRGTAKKSAPPAMGAPEKGYMPLGPAPGTYVFET